jgi:DNA-binding MarR family transcriptional regulator
MDKDDTLTAPPVDAMTAYSPSERELLRAVRDLVAADRRMRQSLAVRMRMNLHDLQALRHVITAQRETGSTTPRRLARELGISTASTTILIDRLVAQGHLQRAPHPTDGRSKTLVATDAARREVHGQLADAHDRMRAVAADVPEDARPAVLAFLGRLTALMGEEAAAGVETAD